LQQEEEEEVHQVGLFLLGGYAYCYGSYYVYVEDATGCAVIDRNAMGSGDVSGQSISS